MPSRSVVHRTLTCIIGIDLFAVFLRVARNRLIRVLLEVFGEARLYRALFRRKIFTFRDSELAGIDAGLINWVTDRRGKKDQERNKRGVPKPCDRRIFPHSGLPSALMRAQPASY